MNVPKFCTMAANPRRAFGVPGQAAIVLFVSGLWLLPAQFISDPAARAEPQRVAESDLWLLPATAKTPELGAAAADLGGGAAVTALAVFSAATRDPMLGG